jgi:hypothetical protein
MSTFLASSQEHVQLLGVCGNDFGRHNNLHRIDDDTVAYVVGNAVRVHSEYGCLMNSKEMDVGDWRSRVNGLICALL